MSIKKVYYDDCVEMEVYSNVNGIHLEVSDNDQEIPVTLTLTSEDAEELITQLRGLIDTLNGF